MSKILGMRGGQQGDEEHDSRSVVLKAGGEPLSQGCFSCQLFITGCTRILENIPGS